LIGPYFILPTLWVFCAAAGMILLPLPLATGIMWSSALLSVIFPVLMILLTRPFHPEKVEFLVVSA
jgi:hypothetical protein